jgi:hypothetical protein
MQQTQEINKTLVKEGVSILYIQHLVYYLIYNLASNFNRPKKFGDQPEGNQ